jgi:hypothetical protein
MPGFQQYTVSVYVLPGGVKHLLPLATTRYPLTFVYMAPLVIILLWVVFVSIFRWRRERAHLTVPGWLPLVSFAIVFLCFLSHYAIFWEIDKQADAATSNFPLLVLLEFSAFSLVLVPILFLSGSDFAE